MNTLTHANFYFPARVSKFKFVVGKEALGGTLPPQIPREHNPPSPLPYPRADAREIFLQLTVAFVCRNPGHQSRLSRQLTH